MMIQTKAILIKFIFYFSLFVCVVIGGCRNDDDLEGCGCNSETITTIQESASLTGEMYYKSSQYSLDEYYVDEYWIKYTEVNCSSCVHTMIVCNQEFLESNFNDLMSLLPGETINVNFAGHLKKLCTLPNGFPADYTYEHITLTKIQRQ